MYEINLAKDLIKSAGLDLNNLTVYTELASHNYFYNAFIPALAGAKRVIVQANDNKYSQADPLIEEGKKIALSYDLFDKMIFVKGKKYDYLSKSDIITNSGNLRPFDKKVIDVLKKTAVIPLMWETWELREDELDLEYCKEKEILVLGTNEDCKSFSMKKYIGLGALKLLFSSGFDGGEIILIGSDTILSRGIFEFLNKMNIEVKWIYDLNNNIKIKKIFTENTNNYSHILIAEHLQNFCLIGNKGILDAQTIKLFNQKIKICVMAGNLDQKYLRENKLDFYPDLILPFGHLSYQLSELGPRPIMSLFVYGLKVGQQMANSRIMGKSIKKTVDNVLKKGLAMNFEGKNAW